MQWERQYSRARAECPYSPGYLAAYFTDPDGLKFESAYALRI
jgi:hypothetical protein